MARSNNFFRCFRQLAQTARARSGRPLYAAAVLIGAVIGTILGLRMKSPWVLRALALVLPITGVKLIGVC